jgi:hypothetical protein
LIDRLGAIRGQLSGSSQKYAFEFVAILFFDDLKNTVEITVDKPITTKVTTVRIVIISPRLLLLTID